MYKKSWLHSWLINPNAWKHSVIFSSWVYKAKGWIWIWKVSFLKEHFSSSRALKIFKLNWFRWRPWQARICWVKLEQGQNSASCQAEKKKICHCLAGAGCVGRFWWQKKKNNPKKFSCGWCSWNPWGSKCTWKPWGLPSKNLRVWEGTQCNFGFPSSDPWFLIGFPSSVLLTFKTQKIFQQCLPNKGVKTWLFFLFFFPSAPLWGMDEWGSSRLRLGWAEKEFRPVLVPKVPAAAAQHCPNLLHTTVSCSFLFSTTG